MLAAALLVAGTMKLAGSQMQVTFFEKIGLGQWFRYFTGGLEVIGAILVLVPRTAVVGAVLLGMTMVGAVNIHLLITGGSPVPSVVLLVIAVAITWYRELYLKSAPIIIRPNWLIIRTATAFTSLNSVVRTIGLLRMSACYRSPGAVVFCVAE